MVSATGTSLSYQWYKDSGILSGQTGSSLALNSVSNVNAGIYSVVVSGACGNAITNSATLTVNQDVVIMGALTNQTVCPGNNVIFAISATGTSLSYQWSKDGVVLSGQSGNSLLLTNVCSTNAGIYSVVVSGACGNAVTNSATLTVNEKLAIAAGLTNQTVCPSDNVTFVVSATGTALTYQWFKDNSLLPGQAGSSISLNSVSNANAGAYSVVVSGACGAAVTNRATLAVNQSLTISAGPTNQTVCAGNNAFFAVSATGTSLTYQWYKDNAPLTGQTGSSITLNNVSNANAGIYSVIVRGACGNPVTNSATLAVNALTAASPMANVFANAGQNVTFTTTGSGSGTLTYVWKKNGTVIPGATNNSLTLTNISSTNAATYTVEVTGTCNTAVQSATLTLNQPPTVSIISPTNGAVFFAPATFTLAANAQDVDGVVTNLEFYQALTNKFGETTNSAPGLIILTNLPVGTYTFTAAATDNMGARGTSAPVTITVVAELPLTVISAIHLDLQTGLFMETVRVFNTTSSSTNAVRIYIGNLDANTTVHNASGTLQGMPYVQSQSVVPAGGYVDMVIEYANPFRVTPNPTLHAVLVVPTTGGGTVAIGAGQHIDRGVMLNNGTFLVEFLTTSNRLYYVQYSSDLMTWKNAEPAIVGTGTRIQWIDNGQPKTDSLPSTQAARFYRVILLP
jgi:hypothetical protein